MNSGYTINELRSWTNNLASHIEGGTLVIRPDSNVRVLNIAAIDEIANLLKFRKNIHTVEVDSTLAINTWEWVAYFYKTIGSVAIYQNHKKNYIRRLTLNNLNLTDIDIIAIADVAHLAKYKYVGLAENNFSKSGFERLVKTVIGKELETRFWVDDYLNDNSSLKRIRDDVSDLYNVAQIFSYLFAQRLPYDLYKTILLKLYTTLKEKDWLKYIKFNSRLDMLLPPSALDDTLAKFMHWLKENKQEYAANLSVEEIKKMVLTDPTCLTHFRRLYHNSDIPASEINKIKQIIKTNLKLEERSGFGSFSDFGVKESSYFNPDFVSYYLPYKKSAKILDFNKYFNKRHK